MREFCKRLRAYGPKRVIKSLEVHLSVFIFILSILLQYSVGIDIVSLEFIQIGTSLAISLIVFILAGLALIVSFTDEEFLALLKDEGIYNNIMFIFQYNVYLAIIVAVIGMSVYSYEVLNMGFFIFLLVFSYMLFSIMSMVGVIVSFGERKARFDKIKSGMEDN